MTCRLLDPASRFDTGTQPTALFLSYLDLSANLLSTFRLPSVNVPENLPNIKTDAPPKPLKWI